MDEQGGQRSGHDDGDGATRLPGDERSRSPEAILSAVANPERRAVIDTLRRAPDGTAELDALVDSVIATVGAEGGAAAPDDRRRAVRIALHHVHLPKLAESRTIRYDADAGRVRYVGGDLERDLVSLVDSPGAE